jgi:hypothetical protein
VNVTRVLTAGVGIALMCHGDIHATSTQARATAAARVADTAAATFVDQYCTACHNQRLKTVLIERYLGAAPGVSALAVGDLQMPTSVDTYQISGELPQDVHFDELPFGTRGGMLVRRTFPLDGEYTFAVQVARGGVFDPSTEDEPYEIELTIDGERAHVFTEEKTSAAAGAGRQSDGRPEARCRRASRYETAVYIRRLMEERGLAH